MVKSIVIITDTTPIGKNSPVEAIRIGSGYKGLGEGIQCKVVFCGDAVLTLSKHLDPTKLGMDSYAEHLEMAELSDLELYIVEEDMKKFGLSDGDLVDYGGLKVIKLSDVIELIQQADTVFRF